MKFCAYLIQRNDPRAFFVSHTSRRETIAVTHTPYATLEIHGIESRAPTRAPPPSRRRPPSSPRAHPRPPTRARTARITRAHRSIRARARRADAPHRRAQRQRAKQPDVHRVLLDPLRHARGPILKQPVHHPGAHGGEGVRHRAQSRGDLGHRSRRASSRDVAARSGPIGVDLWVFITCLEGRRVFVVERYRSPCSTLSESVRISCVRTSRVCAI